jgi:hypothetical protein
MSTSISPAVLESALDLGCEKCGNKYFIEAAMVKKVSALVSPTGKELLVPVPVLACLLCKHVNDIFLPKTGLK